jgi:hypothetical protein
MTAKLRSLLTRRHATTALLLLLVVLAVGTLAACSPYASVNVGIPLHAGPVYIQPSIGVGGYL